MITALHKSLFTYGNTNLFFLQENFFVNQCSLLSNNSVLPADLPQLTNKYLDLINFSSSGIAKIISHLDPIKAHDNDMLNIRMIKPSGNSIFSDYLNEGKLLHEWIKANFVPVHKKGNKQSLKIYRPTSLLPNRSKIFERFIHNKMLTFSLRTIWSLQINQDLDLGTLVLTNYLLLPTKFVNCLMRGLKLEVFS